MNEATASTSGVPTKRRTHRSQSTKTSGGGINRLVTDRKSLKMTRHSSVESSDGNGEPSAKMRKSRSRSSIKDSDDDKSMDEKEYERRQVLNNLKI